MSAAADEAWDFPESQFLADCIDDAYQQLPGGEPYRELARVVVLALFRAGRLARKPVVIE